MEESMSRSALAGAVVVVLLTGCVDQGSTGGPPASPSPSASPEAATALDHVRARHVERVDSRARPLVPLGAHEEASPVLGPATIERVEREGAWLRPTLAEAWARGA